MMHQLTCIRQHNCSHEEDELLFSGNLKDSIQTPGGCFLGNVHTFL